MIVLLVFVAALAVLAAALLLWRARRLQSRLRALEQQLRELELQASRLNEAEARLLATMTHELRTPLTAIMGFQELLADGIYGPLDERAREPVSRIGYAAQQLLHLVDGVVELARLNSGTVQPQWARSSIYDALERAVEQAALAAAERGVILEKQWRPPLPEITTDSQRLQRALELALTAAVRASTGRTLHISATPQRTGVTIEIAGTRLDAERSAAEADAGGDPRTGLRLAVATRIATFLGGTLELVPAPEATTVRLHVPSRAPD